MKQKLTSLHATTEKIVNQILIMDARLFYQRFIHLFQYHYSTLEEEIHAQVNLVRVQQILVNLLTNAEQAMDGSGNIHVSLQTDEQFSVVDVKENGCGISLEEQPFIFDRFYRGEQKKYKVRGLVLGLAVSKMMAQSLVGDLVFIASTEQ
ncbi:ATP-binding protein [Lysinibacillus sp. KU-BSD001]|uniref:ATP-binding protein n=1 Tax=Lysinibacillus sp. KU-BSD001 TaxID=3141328 RepID=UPI0036ECF3F0